MPGGSNQSFGIHVARMSGMPLEILSRAKQILQHLQSQSIEEETTKKMDRLPANAQNQQLMIFDLVDEKMMEVFNELKDIDIERLTPIECMLKLKELTLLTEQNQ